MKEFEIDRTDEEREELVKKWISDNWLLVILAVLLAIGIVYGFNYYKQSKVKALSQTAVALSEVEKALETGDLSKAKNLTATIQQNEGKSSFATVSTLTLAKYYFDKGDYNAAIEQYDWLINQAGDLSIRDIARLRKARAQANQSDAKQADAAIETLNRLEGSDYIAEANWLKGDILAAQKQFDAAKKAYETLKNNPTINAQMLQQRLDLLTIKQQQAEK